MPKITQKGQVTIPQNIRNMFSMLPEQEAGSGRTQAQTGRCRLKRMEVIHDKSG